MTAHKVRCEVVEVATETHCCLGSASCKEGEVYVVTARTPAAPGMRGRAYHAIHPVALGMRFTEGLPFEQEGHIDVVCPDGLVTYRISRADAGREDAMTLDLDLESAL